LKTDDILVKYLLKKKELTLQGFGTFYLSKDIFVPEDSDEDPILPADSLTFDYNPKAKEDDELVNFIVQHTKKIRPLASADLDSYLTLGKQFLNIGKPFVIDGIGTLEKSQEGGLTFKAGQFITPRIAAPKALKENEGETITGLFGEAGRTPPPNYDRKILAIIAGVIILVLAGWGLYYFVFKGKKEKTLVETTVKDSPVIKKDTVAVQKIDSLPKLSDSVNFYIVVRDSLTRKRAENVQRRLVSYGHTTVINYTKDSTSGIYKIGQPFFRPLKDTAALKDSLFAIYRTATHAELK
jgi:hypothetical protein